MKLGSGFLFVWAAQVRVLKVVFFWEVRSEEVPRAIVFCFVCVLTGHGFCWRKCECGRSRLWRSQLWRLSFRSVASMISGSRGDDGDRSSSCLLCWVSFSWE